jgi:MFS family permease
VPPAPSPESIKRIYYLLMLGNTLAASFIWGINTIFLLDAGLTNLEAFAANAFFTAGMVIFEVPTGVVADTIGRRASYLLGTLTLFASTLLYVLLWRLHAPFWSWALVSMLLGLGFTFFSGAVEAWLVDALAAGSYKGRLETVFGHGQAVSGAAMLGGSVSGGYIAQRWNLGVPFLLRAAVLLLMFFFAFVKLKDVGFTPPKSAGLVAEMRKIIATSGTYGFRVRPVKWIMLSGPFVAGVGIYAFYALQPYLLKLYGNPTAYGIAGLAAAIVAGAQIVGGLTTELVRKLFRRRTSVLIAALVVSAGANACIGLIQNVWSVLGFVVLWALVSSATTPIRQAYLNGLIPSEKRATILSLDSMIGSSGGMFIQPALGRVADAMSYGISYVFGAVIELCAVPFVVLARRSNAPVDSESTAPDA